MSREGAAALSEPGPADQSRAGDDLAAELADEFLRRHRAGERPSIEEDATQHPALADQIHKLFPTIIAIELAGLGCTMDLAPAPALRRGRIATKSKNRGTRRRGIPH